MWKIYCEIGMKLHLFSRQSLCRKWWEEHTDSIVAFIQHQSWDLFINLSHNNTMKMKKLLSFQRFYVGACFVGKYYKRMINETTLYIQNSEFLHLFAKHWHFVLIFNFSCFLWLTPERQPEITGWRNWKIG